MNCYRISKYNPQFRVNDKYLINEWTSFSDIGNNFPQGVLSLEEYTIVENYYIKCVIDIMSKMNITELCINELEDYTDTNWKNKQNLSVQQVAYFMRDCLRDKCWAKLNGYNFYLHFGYDYYIYIGTDLDKKIIEEVAFKNSLYAEEHLSPYSN